MQKAKEHDEAGGDGAEVVVGDDGHDELNVGRNHGDAASGTIGNQIAKRRGAHEAQLIVDGDGAPAEHRERLVVAVADSQQPRHGDSDRLEHVKVAPVLARQRLLCQAVLRRGVDLQQRQPRLNVDGQDHAANHASHVVEQRGDSQLLCDRIRQQHGGGPHRLGASASRDAVVRRLGGRRRRVVAALKAAEDPQTCADAERNTLGLLHRFAPPLHRKKRINSVPHHKVEIGVRAVEEQRLDGGA